MDSLIDVNVFVALMHAHHCHSERAVAWINSPTQERRNSVQVCRVVQMGALRVLTRPSIMGDEVLSAAEFWQGWSQVMGDERFEWVDEPKGMEQVWKRETMPFPKGQCAETDAFLAAFARAGNWILVTFDRGFRRFPDLKLEVL